MKGQTVILRGDSQRKLAHKFIEQAPVDAVVNIAEANRTKDQNARLWAMLSDISRAKPEGRKYTAEQWKCVFMSACGWEVQFLEGLDGQPFPAGFRSSKMTKKQMRDLHEYIAAYGDQHGIQWSEPNPYDD